MKLGETEWNEVKPNYTLTAEDPKQRGLMESGTCAPFGRQAAGLEPGGLEARATDFGAGQAVIALRVYRLGV